MLGSARRRRSGVGTTRAALALLGAALAGPAFASLAHPVALTAQAPGQVSVALKAGTVGVGGDVAFALTDRLTLRGGLGLLSIAYDGTFDDHDYRIEPPARYLTLGADLHLLGPLRLIGGLLHRSDPVRFESDLEGSVEIGDQTYTSEGSLNGEVESADLAPYLGLGLGRSVGRGLGIYLDVAVAFTGDPDLTLEASGPITQQPGFQAELERERARAEEDLDSYYRHWPVLSFGVRLGV